MINALNRRAAAYLPRPFIPSVSNHRWLMAIYRIFYKFFNVSTRLELDANRFQHPVGEEVFSAKVQKAADSIIRHGIDESKAKQGSFWLPNLQDANAVVPSSASAISMGAQATSYTMTAFYGAFFGMQLIQGLNILYLAATLLPKTAKEFCLSMQTRSEDPERFKIACFNLWNHSVLALTGVFALVLGALGASALVGAYAGMGATAMAALLTGSLVVGAIASGAFVGRGLVTMLRSIYHLRYLSQFESEISKDIKKQHWLDILHKTVVNPSGNIDWLHCERRVGTAVTEQLKSCFLDEHILGDQVSEARQKELVSLIHQGVYEKKLQHKIIFGVGALMALGGMAGIASLAAAPFTGGASLVPLIAVQGATLACNGLFMMLELRFLGADLPSLLKKIADRAVAVPQELADRIPAEKPEPTNFVKMRDLLMEKDSFDVQQMAEHPEAMTKYMHIAKELAALNEESIAFLQNHKGKFSLDMQFVLEHYDAWRQGVSAVAENLLRHIMQKEIQAITVKRSTLGSLKDPNLVPDIKRLPRVRFEIFPNEPVEYVAKNATNVTDELHVFNFVHSHFENFFPEPSQASHKELMQILMSTTGEIDMTEKATALWHEAIGWDMQSWENYTFGMRFKPVMMLIKKDEAGEISIEREYDFYFIFSDLSQDSDESQHINKKLFPVRWVTAVPKILDDASEITTKNITILE
jgi:hypothetical protein